MSRIERLERQENGSMPLQRFSKNESSIDTHRTSSIQGGVEAYIFRRKTVWIFSTCSSRRICKFWKNSKSSSRSSSDRCKRRRSDPPIGGSSIENPSSLMTMYASSKSFRHAKRSAAYFSTSSGAFKTKVRSASNIIIRLIGNTAFGSSTVSESIHQLLRTSAPNG